MASSSSTLAEKRCVVCSLGSHRLDWASVEYPACDSHSKDEVANAIKAAKQKAKAVPSSASN